jgi:hypothetical protein
MCEWKYSSTHYQPQQKPELGATFHAPAALYPGKIVPSVHWIGGWGSLNLVTKGNFSTLNGDRTPIVEHITNHFTECCNVTL